MTNDISGPIAFRTMQEMGVERVFDPARVVLIPDHFVPAKDARSAEIQRRLKDWADDQGVVFYGQGRGGIEHQVLIEDGWVIPGSVVAGGDSHTCTHGALGSFGTGLGSTDVASCLAFGEFWQVVPGTIRIEFTGTKTPWVSGKDLILAVLAEIGVNGGTGNVLEFVGPGRGGADDRRADGRRQPGGRGGFRDGHLPRRRDHRGLPRGPHRAGVDRGAHATTTPRSRAHGAHRPRRASQPLVARPHSPGNVAPLDDAIGTQVDQVYIGNCSNGTMTDLRQAANILRGRQVHPDVRVIIVPASRKIWLEAMREGLLDVFAEAGAMVSTPTCGACFGGGMGILGPRRDGRGDDQPQLPRPHGRQGLQGVPGQLPRGGRRGRGRRARAPGGGDGGAGVIVEGTAVVIAEDNVDTDVLYPGPFLNIEDPEKMKPHLFEGLDPSLRDQLVGDTVLVVGENFGSGSSREHVPQSMRASGVRCVVGRSLRPHLPPQLHQPGPARAAGARRRGRRPASTCASTPRPAPSPSASATTRPARCRSSCSTRCWPAAWCSGAASAPARPDAASIGVGEGQQLLGRGPVAGRGRHAEALVGQHLGSFAA